MTTPYQDFTGLVIHTVKGKDYEIRIRDLGARVTISAIQGGRIEPLTSDLADAIAGQEHNLYDFCGIRTSDNEQMRIPASRFDEVRLRTLMKRSHTAISIQGVEGTKAVVHIGGRNRHLRDVLAARLNESGFDTSGPASAGAAHNPSRFYNLPKAGGIQIELTKALRQSMIDRPLQDLQQQVDSCRTDRFHVFTAAVRAGLEQYHIEVRADLDLTLKRFEDVTDAFPLTLRSGRHQGHEH